MFEMTLMPRFQETDALGHINNTVPAVWFEQAREPVFRFFTPDLDVRDWHLIIAGYQMQFKAELLYGSEVSISTQVSYIGNSSFRLLQRAYQNGQLCVEGETTLVHFDHKAKRSVPLPDSIRCNLEQHL
ncbi:acyl-CoA thioesterase [Gallaecimonas xiamenensis]|uniref:Thioesterase superfamily protein n=1 Tax=Gallaecimonas xiamenensis 3-C-1 TaxID=745411 RepID=K2IXL1_9GAMM|nr:thioesterase family protein [Gallaecimonas xiamenensis]EKE67392.1 thioesterase superfamily protein [Gallaecimonas xiamenensis 3-C-1]